jgi:hypothetical protein
MRRRTALVPTAITATAALVACLAASLALSGERRDSFHELQGLARPRLALVL